MPKRLIEDVLPLGDLNKTAQKGGGIGSLNAMPPTLPADRIPRDDIGRAAGRAERDTLEKLLVELNSEEWPDQPMFLERSRVLIRKVYGECVSSSRSKLPKNF